MSNVKVGEGNKVKSIQKKAIKEKREYYGQSVTEEDIMKELDEQELPLHSPISFIDKRDGAIEALAKAIMKTEDIMQDSKPNGDAYKKHFNRNEKLKHNLEQIESRN